VVRQRSAKPLFAGSIPAVASRIPLPPDFAFAATVESHGWYQLAPFEWQREPQILKRRERIANATWQLEIRVTAESLVVAATSARGSRTLPASAQEELTRRLRRVFQLDVDLAPFFALTRESAAHAWVERARYGRLLCGSTVFEDAVKIIATTNTTWRQTVRMTELLVGKCGREGAFPNPEDVVRFSESELQEDCRLGYRARSIRALAAGIAEGAIDLEAIADPRQDTAALYRSYLQLPGIGPYGAAHLLAMDGRYDFIAVDTEFRRFVRETYHRGRAVSDAAMLRRYAKWGRWKYLAYWSELHGER
jgi:3-methyladenine DNA glycosylase/8-oxoguanine DNA glycosylase